MKTINSAIRGGSKLPAYYWKSIEYITRGQRVVYHFPISQYMVYVHVNLPWYNISNTLEFHLPTSGLVAQSVVKQRRSWISFLHWSENFSGLI